MNRFIKLVNFEINRFSKLYIGLLILTAISQFVSILLVKSNYMKNAEEANYASSLTATENFISSNGTLSFYQVTNHLLFVAPIAICVALMMLYIFIIWYRDYFGKNTFIYRLFMIPTSRMTVYYAKASTILILVLSLIAFQLILLPIELNVFKNIVPTELQSKVDTINLIVNNEVFSLILPASFLQFLLSYGTGLAFVFVIFTAILLERSYRWKGIVFGIFYCIAILVLCISPLLINNLLSNSDSGFTFYPYELFYIELGVLIIVTAISILFSQYLLKNKVSV